MIDQDTGLQGTYITNTVKTSIHSNRQAVMQRSQSRAHNKTNQRSRLTSNHPPPTSPSINNKLAFASWCMRIESFLERDTFTVSPVDTGLEVAMTDWLLTRCDVDLRWSYRMLSAAKEGTNRSGAIQVCKRCSARRHPRETTMTSTRYGKTASSSLFTTKQIHLPSCTNSNV